MNVEQHPQRSSFYAKYNFSLLAKSPSHLISFICCISVITWLIVSYSEANMRMFFSSLSHEGVGGFLCCVHLCVTKRPAACYLSLEISVRRSSAVRMRLNDTEADVCTYKCMLQWCFLIRVCWSSRSTSCKVYQVTVALKYDVNKYKSLLSLWSFTYWNY